MIDAGHGQTKADRPSAIGVDVVPPVTKPAAGGGPGPAPADPAAHVGQLDEQLIGQLILRAGQVRDQQLSQRAARLPTTSLAQENAMLKQYVSRLGKPGASIVLAILELSRQIDSGGLGDA
jgi:hypothetical protein